jgi:hypothetical protein
MEVCVEIGIDGATHTLVITKPRRNTLSDDLPTAAPKENAALAPWQLWLRSSMCRISRCP